MFYSKKFKKGGNNATLDSIQMRLDELQKEFNDFKNNANPISEPILTPTPVLEPILEPVLEPVLEPMPIQTTVLKPVSKPWIDNKEIKFKDGAGGSVFLSFSRLMTHIDTNIKKKSTAKDWSTIKEKLINANSVNEVQDIINQYKIKLASNYVLGGKTKKKRRHNKRKTYKKH
jgi:hypothetical protein